MKESQFQDLQCQHRDTQAAIYLVLLTLFAHEHEWVGMVIATVLFALSVWGWLRSLHAATQARKREA